MRSVFAWSALVFAAVAGCTSFSADDSAPSATVDAGPGSAPDGAQPSGTDAAGAEPDSSAPDGATSDANDSGSPRAHRYIWVTPIARMNFASIADADARCGTQLPTNRGITKAKALLVGSTRRACTTIRCVTGGPSEHLDWPLTPTTEYRRPADDAVVGTTDANGLFTAALSNAIGTDDSVYAWTGLGDMNTWLTDQTCMDWSSTAPTQYGRAGYTGPGYVDQGKPFGWFIDQCNMPHAIFCVEPP